MNLIGIIVMGITLLSNFLGLIREIIVAYFLGATESADSYNIALLMSEIIISWFSAVLATSFIPIYLDSLDRNRGLVFRDSIFSITLVVSIITSIIGITFSNFFILKIAPGLNEEQIKLVTLLSWIMIPSTVFASTLGILTGSFHINKEFRIPSYSGIVYNLAIIIFSLVLANLYNIVGLAIGYSIGNLTRFIYLYIKLQKNKLKINICFSLKNDEIKSLLFMSIPIICSMFISQLQAIIDRNFASYLSEGSISSLYYSRKVADVPVQVVGGVLSSMIFPSLTKFIVNKKSAGYRATIVYAINLIFLLGMPISTLLLILNEEIIIILFNYGQFDQLAVEKTSQALQYFSYGIIGNCLYMVVIKAYFAKKNTITPLIASFVSLIIYYLLVDNLIFFYGHKGIAFASSITIYITVIILFILLKIRIGIRYLINIIKIIVLNVLLGVFLNKLNISLLLNNKKIMVWAELVIVLSTYSLLYILILLILKNPELNKFIREIKIKRKMG